MYNEHQERQIMRGSPFPGMDPYLDVPLQLQAAVEACFKLVGYERLLDYNQPPPPPPLEAGDEAWVRAQGSG